MAVEMYSYTKTPRYGSSLDHREDKKLSGKLSLAPFTADFFQHYTVGLSVLPKPSRKDCLDGKGGGDRNPSFPPSAPTVDLRWKIRR